MTPEVVADRRCTLGEGVLWHAAERRLYWVDIPSGRLYRYDPVSGCDELCLDLRGEPIGGFTVQADGGLLLFLARGAVRTWRAGRLETVLESVPGEEATRFNDVIADPEGRVFCGTLSTPERPGRLYRLDPDRRLSVVLEGVGTSNGMGFTPDGRGLYHADTRRREIGLFDYDRRTGAAANRRLFIRTADGDGRPDGMTVDEEGHVWAALWGGGCVVRYAPDGRETGRVGLPATNVTSVAFGGDALDELYVTTAGGDRRESAGEGAGALFRLRPGVRGGHEFRSRVGT